MAISYMIERYLNQRNIPYDVCPHPKTATSLRSAEAAGIEPDRLAKAVLLEDEYGYLMAVLPATRHIQLGELRSQMGRDVRMATESEIGEIFSDCDLGAIPAVGEAYGIETIWDESLASAPELYFESGDHEDLIHVDGSQIDTLFGSAKHGHFSRQI